MCKGLKCEEFRGKTERLDWESWAEELDPPCRSGVSKSSPLPVLVHTVLLEHGHAHSPPHCPRLLSRNSSRDK